MVERSEELPSFIVDQHELLEFPQRRRLVSDQLAVVYAEWPLPLLRQVHQLSFLQKLSLALLQQPCLVVLDKQSSEVLLQNIL